MADQASRRGTRPISLLREFMANEASGGLVLMGTALLALVVANSPLAPAYFGALSSYIGPLSLLHWINDGLMAIFFLLVGLEIKREVLDGQLSSWSRRALPGIAALGGMVVPALIFLAFNGADPEASRGWAIPAATDIAFALGVLSLLGSRVPTSLKVFLTALAIIDDLGAVAIIAVFYSGALSMLDLGLAVAVLAGLYAMNRAGVLKLWPYLLLGAVLWLLVLRSGVHATVAGVLLAFTIPLRPAPAAPDRVAESPLHRLEHGMHGLVAFLVIPIFGFANAGVSFEGVTLATLGSNLTLGVALGLVVGKLIGVFGFAALTIRLGWAELPMGASWTQLLGIALLCGIGFTMSLFIGLLAFAQSPLLQDQVKIGILMGSLTAGLVGWLLLRLAPRRIPAPRG
ncbi:Na+/H+ antiporter NhaA [Falsiroseomonas tokyonensis]|uniref:Na(+)/H(+) antiporter NhaA n=1 Tax=Falsiroseomonas tokyonensis TaxID=430521 RepID=A0ABV7C057_9PROT|nr:Na+/H+ antiporter NhaA [Falsiroseomonas tokyonensis]MBU8540059.1 Na+/H+ antiporter NhaA [Falsiroseomonas tokyonensis]